MYFYTEFILIKHFFGVNIDQDQIIYSGYSLWYE